MTAETTSASALIRDVPDYPQPGILFKDITPLLGDAAAFAQVVEAMAAAHADSGVERVVGIEARGFLLAAPVALALGAGFVPVRKQGKLPSDTHHVGYDLEYGQSVLEMHRDAVHPGQRVLVVDDVLATGGTAAATVELLGRCEAAVLGVCVLIELVALGGRDRLGSLPVNALIAA